MHWPNKYIQGHHWMQSDWHTLPFPLQEPAFGVPLSTWRWTALTPCTWCPAAQPVGCQHHLQGPVQKENISFFPFLHNLSLTFYHVPYLLFSSGSPWTQGYLRGEHWPSHMPGPDSSLCLTAQTLPSLSVSQGGSYSWTRAGQKAA